MNTLDRNDEFIDEAISYAVRLKQCNRSMFMRKFKLGYVRAGELSDRVIRELPNRVKEIIDSAQSR